MLASWQTWLDKKEGQGKFSPDC